MAEGLKELGYGIEKTRPDGRFEITGVSREVIEAFSTRRAEIEAAMEERGLGGTGESPYLAAPAVLMTRARKRDVDKGTQRNSVTIGDESTGLCTSAANWQEGFKPARARFRQAGRQG